MVAELGRKIPAMEARMVLIPLRTDLGDVRRVLGCFIAKGKLGTQPRRLEIVTTKLWCLTANKIEQYVPQLCKIALQPSGFREKQIDFNHSSVPTKAPHLRLIKTVN